MELSKRHQFEMNFHERKAVGETTLFEWGNLLQPMETYVAQSLGDLSGKIVLELACGFGKTTLELAEHGAQVYTFDLSFRMTQRTKNLATEKQLDSNLYCSQMAGEFLAFPDNSFDVVYGGAVLHHLELDMVITEVKRVLKPGGYAVFSEPLGENPFINIQRWLTPDQRTPTEIPLLFHDFARFEKYFYVEHKEFYFFSLPFLVGFIRRLIASNLILKFIGWDTHLIEYLPFLRRFCWQTVMKLTHK